MVNVHIPNFVKSMGWRLFSHVLNLSEPDAKRTINENAPLEQNQADILAKLIQIFVQLRTESIEENSVDELLFFRLSSLFNGDRHIFNIWREQLGGAFRELDIDDPIIKSISKLAIEAYPLFLSQKNFDIYSSHEIFIFLYRISYFNQLLRDILNDRSLTKLFTTRPNGDAQLLNIRGQYLSSSGRGGSISLAILPSYILSNAFQLMQVRGDISIENLLVTVGELISLVRNVADGQTVSVPTFLGFTNVGLKTGNSIETQWGTIKPYSNELVEHFPSHLRPPMLAGEDDIHLGFILESSYDYKIDLNPVPMMEQARWPAELLKAREKLENAEENLGLMFALAIDRTPPVGINRSWSIFIDPLGTGGSMSWSPHSMSPVQFHVIEPHEINSIMSWSGLIHNGSDERIRIGIRRLLSSINDRLDPIDGFVDVVIAWENLFGGNAELSYRISVSIAKLLEPAGMRRNELQKKIRNYYNDRSKIVHGVKEISNEEATKSRNECLVIALSAVRKLYIEHPDLLGDPERSLRLALQ